VRWSDITADDIQRVKALSERRLTREEWDAYVNQPVTAEEAEGIAEMLDWFARRYPTAQDRLRYARRAYERWTSSAVAVKK
jgi:hypothetical protein